MGLAAITPGGLWRARMSAHRLRYVGLLAALAAVAGLLERALAHGGLVVQQCVEPNQVGAWFGLHLALLRLSPDCPGDSLALGPDRQQVVTVVVSVAAPVLLAHLAALVAGIGVVRVLRRAGHAVMALLAGLLRRLPAATGVVVGPRPAPATLEHVLLPPPRAVLAAPTRRGPPLVLA